MTVVVEVVVEVVVVVVVNGFTSTFLKFLNYITIMKVKKVLAK